MNSSMIRQKNQKHIRMADENSGKYFITAVVVILLGLNFQSSAQNIKLNMSKLVVGAQAPDFTLNCMDGSDFKFRAYKGTAKYKLLIFWSADCGHCQDLTKEIYQWYNESYNKERVNIVAVSLDETETEVKKWESAILSLSGWKHLRASGGVNSQVANDYAILSTPVMYLVDSQNNNIVAIPENLEQLKKTTAK